MITVLSGSKAEARVRLLESRMASVSPVILETVRSILQDVRTSGDDAVIGYTKKFDGVALKVGEVRVSQDEIDHAYGLVDLDFLKAFEQACENIQRFHECQLEKSWMLADEPGVFLGLKVSPIPSVGAYVPGGTRGTSPLISTAMMCAIPASVAGCRRIVVASPPNDEGTLDPHLLVALGELGVDEIYKMGGAQAIGALAYGPKTIARVDKIVGPGNIYVAMAKMSVAGLVAVDGVAGPSEVAILADGSARADFVASDLIAQAEHDPQAIAILVTTDRTLAQSVIKEITSQTKKCRRAAIVKKSLADHGAILVVDDLDKACELVNRIAPEHLEIVTTDPQAILGRIETAGAIFLGGYTPQVLGDYVAGPNHTLPTAGTARYASPLGVWDFLKRTSVTSYNREALENVAGSLDMIARLEGLDAHADSVAIRLAKREKARPTARRTARTQRIAKPKSSGSHRRKGT